MKIFSIGQFWEGGTCRERALTLQRLGYDVCRFDTSRWTSGGLRVFRTLAHRLNSGPSVWSLNAALLQQCRMIGRVDYVWIDKGVWILPSTLDKIRAFTCAKIVHYSPDAHFFDNRSRHFYECITRYDLIVTTKPFELAEYRKHGAVNVQLVLQGFDPRFAEYPRCESDGEAWGSDVSFVGHCQPHYARRLEFLARTANVSVYGPNWPRYARTHRWARRVVKGPGAWGDDYLKVLAHSRIVLGLLGKHIPETTTTRTFEIPALGSFLLAERTEEHQALFREGVEAEFFGDDCEMRDKVDYYLRNDDARRRIAAAGRVRCHQSGYSSEAQLTKILTRLRYV